MATIFEFERSAECSIYLRHPVSKEEAEVFASTAIASDNLDGKFTCDNFREYEGPNVPAALNMKCLGKPYELDYRSIDVLGGVVENEIATIRFTVTQRCIFFANEMDSDTAFAAAFNAGISDCVESATKREIWSMVSSTTLPPEVVRYFEKIPAKKLAGVG